MIVEITQRRSEPRDRPGHGDIRDSVQKVTTRGRRPDYRSVPPVVSPDATGQLSGNIEDGLIEIAEMYDAESRPPCAR